MDMMKGYQGRCPLIGVIQIRFYFIVSNNYITVVLNMSSNTLSLLLVIIGCVFLIILMVVKSFEGYHLTDLPNEIGYGGYPPNVYGQRLYSTGLYGSPDMYPGYNPAMGLTW